jgi:hypothetical protein
LTPVDPDLRHRSPPALHRAARNCTGLHAHPRRLDALVVIRGQGQCRPPRFWTADRMFGIANAMSISVSGRL